VRTENADGQVGGKEDEGKGKRAPSGVDAENLDLRSLKKSCIHFATPDGRLIPFESYNLFYRPEMAAKLAQIRHRIDVGNAMWADGQGEGEESG